MLPIQTPTLINDEVSGYIDYELYIELPPLPCGVPRSIIIRFSCDRMEKSAYTSTTYEVGGEHTELSCKDIPLSHWLEITGHKVTADIALLLLSEARRAYEKADSAALAAVLDNPITKKIVEELTL